MKKGKYNAVFSIWRTRIVNSSGSELHTVTSFCEVVCCFIAFVFTLLLEFAFPTEKNLFGFFQLLVESMVCYVIVNFMMYVIVNAYFRIRSKKQ